MTNWALPSLTTLTFGVVLCACTTQVGTGGQEEATGGSATLVASGGGRPYDPPDTGTGGAEPTEPSSGGHSNEPTEASTGGYHPDPSEAPHWSDACYEEAHPAVQFTTDPEGCQVCVVRESNLAPEPREMNIVGSQCGGNGLQLGNGWIGCGWVYTTAIGDTAGEGTYSAKYRIVDAPEGESEGGTRTEESEWGPGEWEMRWVVDALEWLPAEEPFECSYANYGEETFPWDCESWEHVCCPGGTKDACDDAIQPTF